jgi:hypothetical protein
MNQPRLSEISDRPNIVVTGVGHSGTRVVIQMLSIFGWRAGDIDDHGELPEITEINKAVIGGDEFDESGAKDVLAQPPFTNSPWVMKDTRFSTHSQTLDYWKPLLGNFFLVYVTRNIEATHRSYRRRKESVTIEHLQSVFKKADNMYKSYQNPKIHIRFEDVCAAATAFDVSRAQR